MCLTLKLWSSHWSISFFQFKLFSWSSYWSRGGHRGQMTPSGWVLHKHYWYLIMILIIVITWWLHTNNSGVTKGGRDRIHANPKVTCAKNQRSIYSYRTANHSIKAAGHAVPYQLNESNSVTAWYLCRSMTSPEQYLTKFNTLAAKQSTDAYILWQPLCLTMHQIQSQRVKFPGGMPPDPLELACFACQSVLICFTKM